MLLSHRCQKSPKACEARAARDLQLLALAAAFGDGPHTLTWALVGIHWDHLGYPEQTPKHSPKVLSAKHTAGWLLSPQAELEGCTRSYFCTEQYPVRHFLVLTNYPKVPLKYSVGWEELEKREDVGCFLLS